MSHPDPFDRRDLDVARPKPMNWMERRRQKIAEEIARNRRGEYVVPTWVLAVTLVLVIVAWIALIVLV
jgi:hypothetical protein